MAQMPGARKLPRAATFWFQLICSCVVTAAFAAAVAALFLKTYEILINRTNEYNSQLQKPENLFIFWA